MYATGHMSFSLVRAENIPICGLKALKGQEVPENGNMSKKNLECNKYWHFRLSIAGLNR